MQRVVAGDLDAFEGIVQRWQHRLINLAWRFCRDRAMAEDIAQEIFIKVYRSLGSFRAESKFSTWITSIALNTYRSRVRTGNWQTVGLVRLARSQLAQGCSRYGRSSSATKPYAEPC